jgi:hypothetical protein
MLACGCFSTLEGHFDWFYVYVSRMCSVRNLNGGVTNDALLIFMDCISAFLSGNCFLIMTCVSLEKDLSGILCLYRCNAADTY